ncbi:MAG TPA: ferrochelatase, partial [Catalimonadaceae bacterium]|nr:ferrochelatase [Catalimonadaceae bacterium]
MKTGILLINLGTPDSPNIPDVRKYLREFLMDKRVIDIPFIPRFLLVNWIIAPFRAPKSAKVYKKVWLEGGSPLKVYGFELANKVQQKLGKDYVVRLAMRYQNPSMESVFQELKELDLDHI